MSDNNKRPFSEESIAFVLAILLLCVQLITVPPTFNKRPHGLKTIRVEIYYLLWYFFAKSPLLASPLIAT
jgi:hypothetical protein